MPARKSLSSATIATAIKALDYSIDHPTEGTPASALTPLFAAKIELEAFSAPTPTKAAGKKADTPKK